MPADVHREPHWTQAQWQAVTETRGDVLVSASAGSGKTAVLTRRCVYLLCDSSQPCNVDELLVITFTRAAAAEMRQRIATELRKVADDRSTNQRRATHARKQLRRLGAARITTIDSFCLDMVRSYFYRLNRSPNFSLLDQDESDLMTVELCQTVFERLYGLDDQAGKDFAELVARYGGSNDDQTLREAVIGIYHFVQNQPFGRRWLDDVRDMYQDITRGAMPDAWVDALQDHVRQLLATVGNELTAIRVHIDTNDELADYDDHFSQIHTSVAEADETARRGTLADTIAAVRRIPHAMPARLPTVKGIDEQDRNTIKAANEQIKGIINQLCKELLYADLDDLLADVAADAPYVTTLLDVVRAFADEFDRAKRRLDVLDFSDIEQLCFELLVDYDESTGRAIPSPVAENCRRQYHFVLVDEYQDVSPLQDAIITMVGRPEHDPRGGNVFMVGDVKQSIYRFRNADPTVFQNKTALHADAHQASHYYVNLADNFRSRMEIIDAVNATFTRLMRRTTAEIEYDSDAELRCAANYPQTPTTTRHDTPSRVSVHILEKPGSTAAFDNDHADTSDADNDPDDTSSQQNNDATSEEAELDCRQREAYAIGTYLRDLLGYNGTTAIQITDKDTVRPAQPEDVAILFRSVSHRADVYQAMLERMGLPVMVETRATGATAIEVTDILSLLSVLDNPYRDTDLAAVLRGPVGRLTCDQLARLRISGGKGALWDILQRCLNDTELGPALTLFIQRYNRWRELARVGDLPALLLDIDRSTGLTQIMASWPDGASRLWRYNHLFDRACQFSRFTDRSLGRFVEFINRLRREDRQFTTDTPAGADNAITIRTIHGSKGLQFPVVVLADMGTRQNVRDVHRQILWDRTMGIALRHEDLSKRTYWSTLGHDLVKHTAEQQILAEELRLLYVAMTRAREHLSIWITDRNDKPAKGYLQLARRLAINPDQPTLKSSHSAGMWVMGALLAGADYLPDDDDETDSDQIAETIRRHHDISVHWYDAQQVASWQMPPATRTLPADDAPVDQQTRTQADQIIQATLWQYPHQQATKASAGMSAGRIKHILADEHVVDLEEHLAAQRQHHDDDMTTDVDHRRRDRFSSVDYGIAVHQVLEHIPLTDPITRERIDATIGELTTDGRMETSLADTIDRDAMLWFFTTSAGALMLRDDVRVYREWPFTIEVSANLLHEDVKDTTAVIVRGVVDCMVVRDDGVSLIDYKTDRVSGEALAQRTAQYQWQLAVYAHAIKTITGTPVTQACLAYLETKTLIAVDTPDIHRVPTQDTHTDQCGR